MRSFLFLSALAFCTAVLPSLYAQENSGSVSAVRFIEGSWKAMAQDRSIDAVWSAPVGESMVGYVRVMKDGKPTLYELFAFEQSEQGLVALVRHFKPGLVAMEEKDQPDHYTFLEAKEGRAWFEKKGGETRVLYDRRSKDEFAIVIGKKDGVEWLYKDFWVFTRVK
jgi:hypothetical protein